MILFELLRGHHGWSGNQRIIAGHGLGKCNDIPHTLCIWTTQDGYETIQAKSNAAMRWAARCERFQQVRKRRRVCAQQLKDLTLKGSIVIANRATSDLP